MGRRQFLASALATSAMGLADKISGRSEGFAVASEKSDSAVIKPASPEEYAKTIKADIVVLGSGAGGLSAAIRARQQGVENVIILEKRPEVGGNSVFAPLPIKGDASNNPASAQEMFNSAAESTHWGGDARIIGTVVDKFEKVSNWLKEFSGGALPGACDGTLIKILKAQAEKLGIRIMCNTRARTILKDENNWTCGVSADQDGKLIKVEAPVTVLATGGFLGDPELMEKYFPCWDDKFSKEVNVEGLSYSGDGIKMALEAGAGNDGTIAFEWSMNKMPFYKGDSKSLASIPVLTDNRRTPEALWVNNVGVRFTNESKLHSTNAIYRQPNKDCFIILDAGIVETLARKNPGAVSPEKLQKEIVPLIEVDQALVTDSVGAVAAWIRGKKHILQHAIDVYNESCEKGRDELYYKDPGFLIPFKKSPFYVFRSGLSLRLTHGPIKVNPMMSVVSRFDFPVPGLMACGADIGGLHTDRFISSAESRSIEWTIASGLGAGENAAAFEHGNKPVKVYEFPKYSAKEVMAGHYENVGTVDTKTAPAGPQPSDGDKSYH
jgi:succinate dehydrogenase/fumarate reductase flavoprotein subunit